MRGQHLFDGLLGRLHHLAQLVQRGGGEHGANEETVGDENAVDLAQCAQDIVRPVQVERGKDDVGAVVLEREEFLVDLHICGFNYGSVFIKALLLELDWLYLDRASCSMLTSHEG